MGRQILVALGNICARLLAENWTLAFFQPPPLPLLAVEGIQ